MITESLLGLIICFIVAHIAICVAFYNCLPYIFKHTSSSSGIDDDTQIGAMILGYFGLTEKEIEEFFGDEHR